jgi:hypothetical protein
VFVAWGSPPLEFCHAHPVWRVATKGQQNLANNNERVDGVQRGSQASEAPSHTNHVSNSQPHPQPLTHNPAPRQRQHQQQSNTHCLFSFNERTDHPDPSADHAEPKPDNLHPPHKWANQQDPPHAPAISSGVPWPLISRRPAAGAMVTPRRIACCLTGDKRWGRGRCRSKHRVSPSIGDVSRGGEQKKTTSETARPPTPHTSPHRHDHHTSTQVPNAPTFSTLQTSTCSWGSGRRDPLGDAGKGPHAPTSLA